MKKCINDVAGIPKSSSPYSAGVVAEGKFLFVSGQGPYDPAGSSVDEIVSCRVFRQQLTEANFAELNQAYGAFFGPDRVRTTIGCQLLNIDVEIDCIVRLP